jgi:imidazolonepropionase
MEILAAGGGIISTVRQTREAFSDELVVNGNARLDKMFSLGTLTTEIKTGYGLNTESELKLLRVIFEMAQMHVMDIVPTCLAAHAVPPEFKEEPDDYVDLICREILPKSFEFYKNHTHFPNEKISIFADVFCERNAFNLEQSRKVLEAAKSLGFKLKAHVDEFTNLGGARLAIELGATSIDHLDAISEEEIELLAASDTIGVVTPTVNFNFGSGDFADARKFIDAGCAVALSTDYNPGSAPCPSLPQAMAIACRYQKLLPAEAFNAATVNAAFAVERGAQIGSIEAGKQADLLIFDTRDYREIAYEFGGNPVEKVIKKGRIINQ